MDLYYATGHAIIMPDDDYIVEYLVSLDENEQLQFIDKWRAKLNGNYTRSQVALDALSNLIKSPNVATTLSSEETLDLLKNLVEQLDMFGLLDVVIYLDSKIYEEKFSLGQYLQKLMEEKDVVAKELAYVLDCDPQTVRNYMNDTSLPRRRDVYRTITAITTFLKLTIAEKKELFVRLVLSVRRKALDDAKFDDLSEK